MFFKDCPSEQAFVLAEGIRNRIATTISARVNPSPSTSVWRNSSLQSLAVS
jgi:hypothetical protein